MKKENKFFKFFYSSMLFLLPFVECFFVSNKQTILSGVITLVLPVLIKAGLMYLIYQSKEKATKINLGLVCLVLVALLILMLNVFIPIPYVLKLSTPIMMPTLLSNLVVYIVLFIIFIRKCSNEKV